MGILGRLFGRKDRADEDEREGSGGASRPVPDWVSLDVEEGVVKVRLFLSPAGEVPSLYEIDVTEADEPGPGLLRCFSPPPDSRAGTDGPSGKAWNVEVSENEVAELRSLARDISLFPVGKAMPSEEAATVELSLTAGQAEARIRWWMSPPREWTGVDRFVSRLRELARRGAGRG